MFFDDELNCLRVGDLLTHDHLNNNKISATLLHLDDDTIYRIVEKDEVMFLLFMTLDDAFFLAKDGIYKMRLWYVRRLTRIVS
jgi:hypothetical protein